MTIRNPKAGHRVMVLNGFLENDTIDFVGQRGTVYAVYSDHPNGKDSNQFCIAVRMDSRLGRDLPMLFRAKDLTSSNPKGN